MGKDRNGIKVVGQSLYYIIKDLRRGVVKGRYEYNFLRVRIECFYEGLSGFLCTNGRAGDPGINNYAFILQPLCNRRSVCFSSVVQWPFKIISPEPLIAFGMPDDK